MRRILTAFTRLSVLLVMSLLLLVPIGEDSTVSGATDAVIGTIARVSVAAPAPELHTGQIAQKYTAAVVVDGLTYYLAPNVLLSDDAGNDRDWNEFKKDDFILFHLHAGQIDALVLMLPR
jgi:hypothetical protein